MTHQSGEASQDCEHLPPDCILGEAAETPEEKESEDEGSDVLVDEWGGEEAVELKVFEVLREEDE